MSNEWYLDFVEDERWCYAPDLFSKDECEKIIKLCKDKGLQQAEVEVKENNETARSSKIHFVDSSDQTFEWIFRRIVDAIKILNDKFYGFDLDKIEILQFTEYSSETADHYKKHIDTLIRSYGYRKLSFSVQLTNSDDYKGGDLNIYTQEDPMVLSRDQGSLVAFPSFRLHEVTPVESGTRYALVGWVLGPKFK